MEKPIEFVTAVRGFHYYQRYWQVTENECLDYANQKENPYDYFAIKTRGKTLAIEISRPTKFLLYRGTQITATR